MAIPSGSGSEVLKRGVINGNAAWSYIRWDQAITASGNASGTGTTAVPTNCIVTVLQIGFCQASGADSLIGIRIEPSGAGVINILHHTQSLPSNQTFMFSDKIVLHPTDELIVYSNIDTDIVFNYIYQDWV
jgi:hypothetical protein